MYRRYLVCELIPRQDKVQCERPYVDLISLRPARINFSGNPRPRRRLKSLEGVWRCRAHVACFNAPTAERAGCCKRTLSLARAPTQSFSSI